MNLKRIHADASSAGTQGQVKPQTSYEQAPQRRRLAAPAAMPQNVLQAPGRSPAPNSMAPRAALLGPSAGGQPTPQGAVAAGIIPAQPQVMPSRGQGHQDLTRYPRFGISPPSSPAPDTDMAGSSVSEQMISELLAQPGEGLFVAADSATGTDADPGHQRPIRFPARFGVSPPSSPPRETAAARSSLGGWAPVSGPASSARPDRAALEAAPQSQADIDEMIAELLAQSGRVIFEEDEQAPRRPAEGQARQAASSSSSAATKRLSPAELQLIAQQLPQRNRESKIGYARRLYQEHPRLSLDDLSQLSGTAKRDLRRDPKLESALSAELAAVRQELPRGDGESDVSYARRLHQHGPQLSLKDLSQLSGIPEHQLRLDRAFAPPLSAELAAVSRQLPRGDGETSIAYARRLHQHDPELSLEHLSRLSGVAERHLRQDPEFAPPLSAEEAAAQAAVSQQLPRAYGESNIAYARRLHQHHPQLSLKDLSRLSHAPERQLRQHPEFRPPPSAEEAAAQAAVSQQLPRHKGEKSLPYARRLHQHDPQLSLQALSQLSGMKESDLAQDPAFWPPLPAEQAVELAAVAERLPRLDGEKSMPYARRLHQHDPQLSEEYLARLSGALPSHIRQAFRRG